MNKQTNNILNNFYNINKLYIIKKDNMLYLVTIGGYLQI